MIIDVGDKCVNKTLQETTTAQDTLVDLAAKFNTTPERLQSQFKDAGIIFENVNAVVSQEQKQVLLRYLQQHHGAQSASEKIVLRRAKVSEIKLSGSVPKTVSVQVRKKRTYVKSPQEEAIAPSVSPDIAQADQIPTETKTIPASMDSASAPIEQSATTASAPVEAFVEKPVDAPATKTAEVLPADIQTAVVEVSEEDEAHKHKKRKEKTSGEREREEEARNKKKRRTRTQDDSSKQFESLLSRGAKIMPVISGDEEEDMMALAERRRRHHKEKTKSHQILSRVSTQAFTKPIARMVHEVEIPKIVTVSELAQRMSLKGAELVKTLFQKMGMVATINQPLDQDTALLLVEELGHKGVLVNEDALERTLEKDLAISGELKSRPPVITIMGHVDHGKTTLLDYIRRTKVAAQEAGGITQHIGAYHVETDKGTVTFLDTPGHAAFTAMRARGAKLTDIVILVVAADDGVMPQTIEAISHAQAAKVPLVVAVNKMDKHGADPDRIKTELSKHNLIPEEWGGETMFVPISAKTGMGVDALLDSLLVQAEVLDLKASYDCAARGVVIESRMDKGRGAVMSVLIQQGMLRRGDIVLAGLDYGRIRALFDERGLPIQEAGPSIPVEILGMSSIPQAGDDFIVVPDEKRAREITQVRQIKDREAKLLSQLPKSQDIFGQMNDNNLKQINIVLKADVQGSVEALRQALLELTHDEVKVQVLSSGVGGITESDVNLAVASQALLIAFNVRASSDARKLIETHRLDVQYHNIIYDVIDRVKQSISGALSPVIQEKAVGLAQVREVFRSSKTGAIAGCMVIDGVIKRNLPIRILRDNVVIFEGALESLRRFKEDASEVRNGMECGIVVKNYQDVRAGDQIEVYEKIEIKREV